MLIRDGSQTHLDAKSHKPGAAIAPRTGGGDDWRALKSQVLSVVGHELRTPINAIVGFSELLARGDGLPAESRREYCETILENASHLQQLIHDMLDAARIESGSVQLNEQDVAAAELMESAIAICRQQAVKADVHIVAHLADQVMLYADVARMKQALSNLVGNAVKFSGRGGIINISMQKGPDGQLIFSIRDGGIGINAKDIERVFEPFVQVQTGLGRAFGGMGLGLSNARAFARLHGGDVRLDSSEGAGTVAQMILPADRVTWPRSGTFQDLSVA